MLVMCQIVPRSDHDNDDDDSCNKNDDHNCSSSFTITYGAIASAKLVVQGDFDPTIVNVQ